MTGRLLDHRLEPSSLGAALGEQMRAMPWYVGSLGIHLLLMALLMAVPADPPPEKKAPVVIEVISIADEAEKLEPVGNEPDELVEMVEFQNAAVDLNPVNPDSVPLDIGEMDSPVPFADADADAVDDLAILDFDVNHVPNISVSVSAATIRAPANARLRSAGSQRRRIRQFGGAKAVGPAIQAALEFLKTHQPATGLYGNHCDQCKDGHGPSPSVDPAYHASATALAALAFMGNGSSSAKGPYREQVARCLKALLDIQNEKGEFYVAEGKIPGGCPTARPYANAVVLWAVAEAQWMKPEKRLHNALERGVAFAVSRQRDDGGWFDAHTPDPGRSDTFTTAWYVMALLQARDAGVEVPGNVLRNAQNYFLEAAYRPQPKGGESRLALWVGGKPGAHSRGGGDWTIDAAGLACLQFLGVPRRDPKVRALGQSIADHLRSGRLSTMEGRSLNFFGQYFASLGLFQFGAGRRGEPYRAAWSAGNDHIVSLIPSTQHKDGKAGQRLGSWNPAMESAHGPFGARVGLTAAGALIMQVFYRYDLVSPH